MGRLISCIEQQLQLSSGRNIFYLGQHNLHFSSSTHDLVKEQVLQKMTLAERETIIEEIIKAVVEQFYEVNQFYAFDEKAICRLRLIYQALMRKLINISADITVEELADIEKKHYSNLRRWLSISNSFAEKIYASDQPLINTKVVCAEYSPELQLQVLGIQLGDLKEPVLDIGCGKSAFLVKYLQKNGLDVYGIDRLITKGNNLIKIDWLDFNYKKNSWGTIISNLAFSNHFHHNHMRADGDYQQYANTYLEILFSLRVKGSFYYSPDLPFIEKHLDLTSYNIYGNNIVGTEYKTSRITRLK